MGTFFFIHDLKDPSDPQGRSYKQVNAEKTHAIPIGSLVELPEGVRLFVASHERDCDQTPLYWLTPDYDDFVREREGWANPKWIGGYSDTSLVVIRGPLTTEEIDALESP